MHIVRKYCNAALVATFAATICFTGVSAQENSSGQKPQTLMDMLNEHWANAPMGGVDGYEEESYSKKIPLCGNPIVGDCVFNAHTLWIGGRTIRLSRFDTPKENGRCEAERRLALKAAQRISDLLSSEGFTMSPASFGQYELYGSRITIGSRELSQILVSEGLVRERRSRNLGWCADLLSPATEPANQIELQIKQLATIGVIGHWATNCGYRISYNALVEAHQKQNAFTSNQESRLRKYRGALGALHDNTLTDYHCEEWRELARREGLLAEDNPAGTSEPPPAMRKDQQPRFHEGPVPICSQILVGTCVINGSTLRIGGRLIRLKGVNAPDLRGRCEAERRLGALAAQRLSSLLSAQRFSIRPAASGKDGTTDATVSLGSRDVGRILIDEGLAGRIDQEEDWCMQEKTRADEEAEQSWGKRLNPSGEIPKTGFRAVYFDRRSFFPNINREHSDTIAIKYIKNELHGIAAGNFGGYWIGRLTYDQPTTKTINVIENGATRIRVNGVVIYETGMRKREFSHEFSAGENILEVEYANGSHTVGFKVTLQDRHTRIARSDLPGILERMQLDNAALYYAGIYVPSTRDFTVRIDPPKTDRPLVLWLDSHATVDWFVAGEREIALAIVASFKGGTNMTGGHVGKIVHLDKNLGVSNLNRKCTCRNGRFRCEHTKDLLYASEILADITGTPLQGYRVAYQTDAVSFDPFDRRTVEELNATRAEEIRIKQSCRR